MALKNFGDFVNEGMNEDAMSALVLPENLSTIKDVEQFLLTLAKAGKIYHFDDDASDIIDMSGKEIFSPEEAEKVNKLMDQAFDICQKHYKIEHGFWEGMVKEVHGSAGLISFTADEDPTTGDIYIISGSGGPGNVKKTSIKDYNETIKSSTTSEDGDMDEDKIDAWFKNLQDAA